MYEEGEMTEGKTAVKLESPSVGNLPDVDIEDVDHDGTLDHVDNGKGKSDHWNGEVDHVSGAVLDLEVLMVQPGKRKLVLHYEEDCHHHLNRGLDTAGYTVGNPREHLQSRGLHVVLRRLDCKPNVPQVDHPTNRRDKRIEKQAEKNDQYEMFLSFLEKRNSYNFYFEENTINL